jgi:hypothetical protein
MSFIPVRFALTVKGKICRLWRSRPAEQRTFLKLHQFESDMWHRGLRLAGNSFDHRQAVLALLKGLISRERGLE